MRGNEKVVIFFLSIALLFKFWFFTASPNLGSDISYRFLPITKDTYLPFTWNNVQIGDGMGLPINTLWSYPSELLYESLTNVGIPYWFQIKYLMLLPAIAVSLWGFIKLAKYYEADWLVSSLLYIMNTYFILLLDGAQMNLVLAYSVFPLAFYFFINTHKDLNYRTIVAFIISVWVMGSFDLRIVWILAFAIIIKFLVDLPNIDNKSYRLQSLLHYGLIGMATATVLFLLNMYWILPAIMSKGVSLPAGYDSPSGVYNLSFSTITHGLYLQQPHWYINSFGRISEPQFYFAVIPLFVYMSVMSHKRKQLLYILTLSVIGIFLSKGSQPPLGEVYVWLFKYVPGFNLFRDPSKFYILIAFSYSILAGLSSKLISKKSYLPSLIFIIYLLMLMGPVLKGKMTGTFSNTPNEKHYWTIADIFKDQNYFFRSFWIPVKTPLGYVSSQNPSTDAIWIAKKRPFGIGTVGTYEQFNYLREAPFMGELFAMAGIKYLYYPYPDTRRETLKQDNIDYYYNFLDQLTNLPWIEKRISDPPIAVLQTKKTQDHIFLSDNSFYVVGSDRIYWDLMEIPDFDLSNNALVFAEEKAGMINDIDPNSKVILYEKSDTDLLMSMVNENEFYFPAKDLGREPSDNVSGLWKRETSDLIWWRDFLQSKYEIDNLDFDYNGGWAIAEGDQKYELRDMGYGMGDSLFVRVMESGRGGRVEFWQGEEKIGEVDTLMEEPEKVDVKLTGYKDIPRQITTFDKAEFGWKRIGKLEGDPSASTGTLQHPSSLRMTDSITIKTYGEINVINAIVTISDEELEELQGKVEKLENEGRITNFDGSLKLAYELSHTPNSIPHIAYTRVNPTKYEIEITGLQKPAYLIFSETFDELWELNGQPSKRVYSLLNGFYVDKDGKYTLFFTPQKYVWPGLVVSAVSLAFIIGLLSYRKLRKKI